MNHINENMEGRDAYGNGMRAVQATICSLRMVWRPAVGYETMRPHELKFFLVHVSKSPLKQSCILIANTVMIEHAQRRDIIVITSRESEYKYGCRQSLQ
jgi:hypothetical protein